LAFWCLPAHLIDRPVPDRLWVIVPAEKSNWIAAIRYGWAL
jgi:hypothetical protein